MPGATGSGKGLSKGAFGFVLVELAIILSALSPKLERVGGRGGRCSERERRQFASGCLGQVA